MSDKELAPSQSSGGLIAVEQQRAIAEVQARMMIARANPRDAERCRDLILEDCNRLSLAEEAMYSYSRGGTDISGPSVRLAEALARRWGNLASGIKEVSRSPGYSECVAYAWDLETGYYEERQFQVRHWRDTKKGGYALNDERDIYELIANMGQRRKRAVLLSIIPGDICDAAVHQCERTMKTKVDLSPEALEKMVIAFTKFGVTKEQIEKRIQRRIESIQPAHVVSLKKIYASLRDGMSDAREWFEAVDAPKEKSRGVEGLRERIIPKETPPREREPGEDDEGEFSSVTIFDAVRRIDAFHDIDKLDEYLAIMPPRLTGSAEVQETIKLRRELLAV